MCFFSYVECRFKYTYEMAGIEKGLKGEGEHERVMGEGKRTLLCCLSHRDMTSRQEPEERKGLKKSRENETRQSCGMWDVCE